LQANDLRGFSCTGILTIAAVDNNFDKRQSARQGERILCQAFKIQESVK
jgi:hypothetical protein